MSLEKRNDDKQSCSEQDDVKSLSWQTSEHRSPSVGWGEEETHPGVSQVLLCSFRMGKGCRIRRRAESLREEERRIKDI